MKGDIFNLGVFREKLEEKVKAGSFSAGTMSDYLGCLDRLNRVCNSTSTRDIPDELEKQILKLCDGKEKQVRKYLSAIRRYERDMLGQAGLLLYGEPLARLWKFKPKNKGIELAFPEKTYLKKINRLNDERLKLAFRLQYKSGLRISEVAALTADDIEFRENNNIALLVKNGKGRKARIAHVEGDKYLYDKLKAYLDKHGDRYPLFYSNNILALKAGEKGIKTHDLRRSYARQKYRKEIAAGSDRRTARKVVAKELGHEDTSITNVYLGDEWNKKWREEAPNGEGEGNNEETV